MNSNNAKANFNSPAIAYCRYPILACCILLAACGGGSSDTGSGGSGTVTPTSNNQTMDQAAVNQPTSGAQVSSPVPAELTVAQHKWESAAIRNYEFTYRPICFCIVQGDIKVIVHDGIITRAYFVDTGMNLDAEQMKTVPTLSRLFDIAEEAYAQHAAEVRFTPNAKYGYLEFLYINPSFQMADEEYGYEVTGFSC